MASREGELQLLRDLQRIVHQIYMREMERTCLFAGVGRVAVDELIRLVEILLIIERGVSDVDVPSSA